MTSTFNILPVNKTVLLKSPIFSEFNLIRTGTIKTNSFFHSFFHAYTSDNNKYNAQNYINMDIEERRYFIKQIKKVVEYSLTKWDKMENSEKLHDSFLLLLTNYHTYITKNEKESNIIQLINDTIKEENDNNIYKIIFDMLPIYMILDTIGKMNDMNIERYKSTIKINLLTTFKKLFNNIIIDTKYIKFYCNKVEILLDCLLKNSEHLLSKNIFKIDETFLNFFADMYNRDIYFFDNQKMPFLYAKNINIKNRKSIILICNQSHYEIIGIKTDGISREFENTHPLIQKLNILLLQPDRIHKLYPNDVCHLPKIQHIYINDTFHSTNDEEGSELSDVSSVHDNHESSESSNHVDENSSTISSI